MKQIFKQLSVLPFSKINLMEAGIILNQNAYELQKPLNCKIVTRSGHVTVLTELGWVDRC